MNPKSPETPTPPAETGLITQRPAGLVTLSPANSPRSIRNNHPFPRVLETENVLSLGQILRLASWVLPSWV
jgi:hypothetical protein